MEFGLEKFAILTIHREVNQTQAIELLNKQTIKRLSLEDSYKYLGILLADDIKHQYVKKKATSKYMRSPQSSEIQTE